MEEYFQIFIALPTDDVCTLRDLSDDTRIYQLKSRVELKTGIPGDIQHLYFMNKELHDDIKLVDVKVKQGCIVRVTLEPTWSNLFEACWRGDIYEVFQNGVQFLDESEFKGYNIGLWNRLVIQRATNALFIASHRGFLGLIMELLNHGAADINGKTRFGRTCLHVAAYQGFVGCVSLLLSEGALSNQVDYNGKTPLALASENGHIYCEKRLWLYQMNLRKHAVSSPNRFSEDSKTMTETTKDLNGRVNSIISSKGLHLSGNKGRLSQGEEKQDIKNFELHLPRVQSSDRQNSASSSPGPEAKENSTQAQFPLVQIEDKYRREYRELQNSYLPNMGKKEGPGAHRPQTAPGPSRSLKIERLETKCRNNALEQVKEANTKDLKQEEKSQNSGTRDSKESVSESINNSSVVQDTSASAQAEKDENKTDRPQSSRTSNKRHLDVVMTSSRVRSKSEEATTLKPEIKTSPESPSTSSEPALEHDYMDVTEHAYRPRKHAQTFDTWLEKKRNQGQLRPATAHAPEKSKMGKSIDPEVFKNWLNKKRHHHYRSNSESSSSGPKKTYISSGLTFDKWLEEKKKMAGKERDCQVSESNESSRKPHVILSGKSYEEWLNEKLAQTQPQGKEYDDQKNKNSGQKSGKTFETWLLEKKNQKQIEMIHKATTEKVKQRRLEYEQYQRYLNPNYRSFEEWLAIKQQEHLLERVRAENEPKDDEITSDDKKKDNSLVFDIWLTMKFVQEMKVEEEKYREMKERWERREKQREAMRRAIRLNKIMKQQNTSKKDQQICKKSNQRRDIVDKEDEIMECIETL